MMKPDIRIRTAKFLWTQGAILLAIMAAFFMLCSAFFVNNATRWHRRNIEQDLLMFAEQASRSGEIPKRGDLGPYTFFILNTDGKFLLPRFPRSDENEKLWQEYQTKLVYELQKRRDGWSAYPDNSGWNFDQGQYVIRYVFVEKLGWIVAAEGYLPSIFSLLQGILTPKLFLGILVIIIGAIVFMLFNASWHFHRVVRAILRSQENNIIADDGHGAPREVMPLLKKREKAEMSGIIRGSVARSLPKREPVLPPEDLVAPDREEALSALARQGEALRAKPKTAPGRDLRELDDLGSVKIDTEEIRSPLLRRAIEELRRSK